MLNRRDLDICVFVLIKLQFYINVVVGYQFISAGRKEPLRSEGLSCRLIVKSVESGCGKVCGEMVTQLLGWIGVCWGGW